MFKATILGLVLIFSQIAFGVETYKFTVEVNLDDASSLGLVQAREDENDWELFVYDEDAYQIGYTFLGGLAGNPEFYQQSDSNNPTFYVEKTIIVDRPFLNLSVYLTEDDVIWDDVYHLATLGLATGETSVTYQVFNRRSRVVRRRVVHSTDHVHVIDTNANGDQVVRNLTLTEYQEEVLRHVESNLAVSITIERM